MEEKKKLSESTSKQYEECVIKIRENIKDAEQLISQEKPTIKEITQIKQQTVELLQHSQEVLKEPENALEMRNELKIAHDQLNLMVGKINDKENQLTSKENKIEEAYRLMDLIKNVLEQELADAPFDLNRGIEKSKILEVKTF